MAAAEARPHVRISARAPAFLAATGSSNLFANGSPQWEDDWSLGFRLPVHEATSRTDEEAFRLRVSSRDRAEWWRHGNETLGHEALVERLEATFDALGLAEPSAEDPQVAAFSKGDCGSA